MASLCILSTEYVSMKSVRNTERHPVARKRTDAIQPQQEPPFERVELQAPPGWTEQVDAAAKALGMSRSAYIRMAVAKQMRRDRQEQGGED